LKWVELLKIDFRELVPLYLVAVLSGLSEGLQGVESRE
jgi:hypothetical protein